jgi:hypothetical protein
MRALVFYFCFQLLFSRFIMEPVNFFINGEGIRFVSLRCVLRCISVAQLFSEILFF